MSNIMISRGGQTYGPYTPAEVQAYLASGELSVDDHAWSEGLPDWVRLATVLECVGSRPGEAAAPVFTDIAPALPDGVAGFSWGGLLFSPVWSIGNRVWPGLLTLIPGLGILVSFWLGFKGRELAWRKGGWQSVAHFERVQRRWTVVGVIGFVVVVVVTALAVAQRQPMPQQAAPVAQAEPAQPQARPEAPPAAQPAPAQPARQLQRPIARDQLEAMLRGMPAQAVEAVLGQPYYQKSEQGLLAYAYLDLTRNPASGGIDKIAVIFFRGGTVAGFHYQEKV